MLAPSLERRMNEGSPSVLLDSRTRGNNSIIILREGTRGRLSLTTKKMYPGIFGRDEKFHAFDAQMGMSRPLT